MNRTSHIMAAFVAAFLLVFPAAEAQAVTVGFVLDGPSEELRVVQELFARETAALLTGIEDAALPDDRRLVADFTAAGARAAIGELMSDDEVDIIVTTGVIAADVAARMAERKKPVVAPFILDRALQGLPESGETSGVKNLAYITYHSTVSRDIAAFSRMVPLGNVAVVVSPHIGREVPAASEMLRRELDAAGVSWKLVPAGKTAAKTLERIPKGADGVYVTPELGLPPGEFVRFAAGLVERNLPSFTYLGGVDVRRGILAGLSPESDFTRIARLVALHVQQIALGGEPSSLAPGFQPSSRLVINMQTARSIGYSPSYAIRAEAHLLNEDAAVDSAPLSITAAVDAALSGNADIGAARFSADAAKNAVWEARSRILPQVELSATGARIDEDRASAVVTPAEETVSGTVRVRQVLWAEPALAGVDAAQKSRKATEFRYDKTVMDIASAAASAYLDVLRAEKALAIRRDNVELTRSNLELAESRVAVGQSGRSDVYRLQSRLASARKEMVSAEHAVEKARSELNRLMNRGLETDARLVDVSVDTAPFITAYTDVGALSSDPSAFRRLRDYLVDVGMTNAPELMALDASISATERLLRSKKREFWQPTVALEGSYTRLFRESGAGSDTATLPPSLAPIGALFPEQDDDTWSIGVNVSIPLAEGGGRYAAFQRLTHELGRLRHERTALAARLEQRIRASLHDIAAAYASIGLSADAAVAAQKNRELVIDNYRKGTVSIIELLDAQNASLVADLVAANAVTDFLKTLMEVERAVGRIDFMHTETEQRAFAQKLEAVVQAP